MIKIRIINLIMTLVFSATAVFAQPAKNITTIGSISGIVTDKSNGKPIDFVPIAIYSADNNKVVTGMITVDGGKFTFNNIDNGNYYLVAEFIGYKKIDIKALKITDKSKKIRLEIKLQKSDIQIKEVTVSAEKNYVDYKIDRKVVNVEKNITAAGGTAADALQNVPSVETDIEGNVTLRGSSEYTVLIDGRPTILEGSDALNQMPASLIKNIEVITNPSAKFDPDGTAGIINIVTKKNKVSGFTGLINLSAGTSPQYGGDVFLKYSTNKYSISGGIDYSNRNMDMFSYSERNTFFNNNSESLISNGERSMERGRASIKGAFDYNITDANSISAQIKYSDMSMNLNSNTLNGQQLQAMQSYDYFLTKDKININPKSYQFSIDDIHKFNDNGHQLSASFQFTESKGEKDELMNIYNSDIDWNELISTENNTRTTISSWNKYRFEIDYYLPIKENHKIETGFQYRLYDSKSEYTGSFTSDSYDDFAETDNSELNRNIYAAYASYTGKFGNLQMKLGLRTEYTDREFNQLSLNNKYTYENIDLYPSAYLTYKINKTQQIQLNYSKRLNRPRERSLNPYVFFSDGYTLLKGNPELEPEYANLLELNYMMNYKLGFISLEAFYRQTDNKMSRYGELNTEGVLEYSWGNLDKDVSIGTELMINTEIAKWWSVNLNTSIFQYQLIGEYSDETVERTSTNMTARLMSNFKFKTNTSFQINGMYRSPSATIDGEREAMYFVSAGIKQDLFKRKLSVSLNVKDIFQTGKRVSTTETDTYNIYSEMYRQAPTATIKLSYKLNSYKGSKNRNKEASEYDMYIM